MTRPNNTFIRILPFIAVAVLSIGLRLYHIYEPVADWHSFRQVDTASVARRYGKEGINLFIPKYDDLSNIQSGHDNPNGYRMVEFPLYQGIAAFFYTATSFGTIELWLRVLTIMFSTGTALLLGYWVSRRVSYLAGLSASFLYAVLPYSIFYGRVILPDPFMVFLSVASLVFLDLFIADRRYVFFACSIAFGALAFLVKPFAGFLFVPVPFLILGQKKSLISKCIECFVWGGIVLAPFLWWRQWIAQFPEGIPASDWLFNANNIRFKGAWFEWLFAQRIGKLILGYWGLILLGAGLMLKRDKGEGMTFRWLLAGSLLYLIVIASGNVQHDYYQILLLPVICIYAGRGIAWMVTSPNISRIAGVTLAGVSVLFAVAFSWFTIRTYYWINRPEIVEAGKTADAILPKDAKVIAPYNGDTTFLYQTNRSGWPLGFDIDKKIRMGATHYVTVSPTDSDLETKDLSETYMVLVRNDRFAIIDLTKKN